MKKMFLCLTCLFLLIGCGTSPTIVNNNGESDPNKIIEKKSQHGYCIFLFKKSDNGIIIKSKLFMPCEFGNVGDFMIYENDVIKTVKGGKGGE